MESHDELAYRRADAEDLALGEAAGDVFGDVAASSSSCASVQNAICVSSDGRPTARPPA